MAIGRATKMGWKRRKSGDKFEIVIELDYAPGWPIGVVWNSTPIALDLLSLREECARIVEASGCGECDNHKIVAAKIRAYNPADAITPAVCEGK